ncbi:sensor histidine kinase [Erwinia typographi]|uniref:sensor histidine kinase n=1 Tax=Erwinia typographi TaxID=371042 RepID=UPI0006917746|nr:HAMP domain-containing sensor histidine kinase [Erwinia typographi]
MKKLTDYPMYQQIFFAVTSAILAVVFCTIALWLWLDDNNRHLNAFATFTDIVEESLPPASASTARQAKAVDQWIARTHTRFALFTPGGKLISHPLNPPMPYPERIRPGGYFDDWAGTRFVWQFADGRVLVVQLSIDRANRPWIFICMVLAMAFAVALVSWPIVRRLTARLETLQQSVESLGNGQLSSRVIVSGNDEVARLALSYNRSASQLEKLVSAQKNMLARASHELRSPLARIQMASALLASETSPAADELRHSVAELDELVEEILTMSRLEGAEALKNRDVQRTDVTAIAAEECARSEVELDTAHVIAFTDPTLIRRMMRNLIENALKHGAQPVSVSLHPDETGHFIFTVSDRGKGIPDGEISRIFAPFYRLPQQNGAGGTGLGLALVKAVCEYHGGTVTLANIPSGGACFTVSIPLGA